MRGQIKPLASVSSADLDALISPGGFGAAKNLCDFTVAGKDMKVVPQIEKLVRDVRSGRRRPESPMRVATYG